MERGKLPLFQVQIPIISQVNTQVSFSFQWMALRHGLNFSNFLSLIAFCQGFLDAPATAPAEKSMFRVYIMEYINRRTLAKPGKTLEALMLPVLICLFQFQMG